MQHIGNQEKKYTYHPKQLFSKKNCTYLEQINSHNFNISSKR